MPDDEDDDGGGFFDRLKRKMEPKAAAAAPAVEAAAPPAAEQAAPQPAAAAPPPPPPAEPAAAPAAEPTPERKKGGFFDRLKQSKPAETPSAPVAAAPAAAPPAAEAPAPAAQPAAAPAPAQPPVSAQALQGQIPAAPPQPPPVPKSPAEVGGLLSRFKLPGRSKEPEPVAEVPAEPAAPEPMAVLEAPPTYKAPVPEGYKTWMWPAAEIEQKRSGPGKIIFLLVLLLLLLAAAAAGAWYFLIRDEEDKAAATTSKTTPPAEATPLQAFVGNIDGLLRISARDRAKIKRAIIGVEKNCSIPPGEAAADVNEVTTSRRAVLGKVRAMKPPNAQSRQVVNLFQRSLTLSISANGGYSKWLKDLQASPAACRRPAANPNYQAAQGINAQTQTAKKAFVRVYNPLAQRFDRRTWTSLQI